MFWHDIRCIIYHRLTLSFALASAVGFRLIFYHTDSVVMQKTLGKIFWQVFSVLRRFFELKSVFILTNLNSRIELCTRFFKWKSNGKLIDQNRSSFSLLFLEDPIYQLFRQGNYWNVHENQHTKYFLELI